MPARSSLIFWAVFLTATIASVGGMLAVLLGSTGRTPLVKLSFVSINSTEATYDLLVGASEICSTAGAGTEDWSCLERLPEDAPPSIRNQLADVAGFQRSLKLPAFACLLAMMFWLLLAIIVALVGHLGHKKEIPHDRHIHIYTPLFSWSALLVQSFLSAAVCIAAGLAVQLAFIAKDTPEEGYTVERKLGTGLWALLAAATICSFALFGSFARTAFHRLHHLHLPMHGQHMAGYPQAAPSYAASTSAQEKISPIGSAVVMRPSWVQRKLSTEAEDTQVEDVVPQPIKNTRIASYAPSSRSSLVESPAEGALSQPPIYRGTEGKGNSSRQR